MVCQWVLGRRKGVPSRSYEAYFLLHKFLDKHICYFVIFNCEKITTRWVSLLPTNCTCQFVGNRLTYIICTEYVKKLRLTDFTCIKYFHCRSVCNCWLTSVYILLISKRSFFLPEFICVCYNFWIRAVVMLGAKPDGQLCC